jgi:hypothetical protein
MLDDDTPENGWDSSWAGAGGGSKVETVGDNRIPVDEENNANPGGKNSLRITWEQVPEGGAWWTAKVAGLNGKPNTKWPTHNLTTYTLLSFWVKGETGGEELTVRLEDNSHNKGKDAPPNSTNAIPVEVNSEWTKFECWLDISWFSILAGLNDFFDWAKEAWPGNDDAPRRDRIMQVVFSGTGSGTVWIDDIRFIRPSVNFTSVPQSGGGEIGGTASNVNVTLHKIALYALTDAWYIQPYVGSLISIDSKETLKNGTWNTFTRRGTRFAALVVKDSVDPPDMFYRNGLPCVGGDVFACAIAAPITVKPKCGAIGDTVTITMDTVGSYKPDKNFGNEQGALKVTFNGVDAGKAEPWKSNEIEVKVPQGATSGSVVVTVDEISWMGTTKFIVVELWDVNRDKVVNMRDLVIVGQNFGLLKPPFPNSDVNKDGTVDILDLVLIGQHFGKRYQ